MKPARLMVGLSLTWLLAFSGLSWLDEKIMPPAERQAVLAAMHADIAQTCSLDQCRLAELRRAQAEPRPANAAAPLLAEK